MICVRQRKATPGESPVAKLLRPSLATLTFLVFFFSTTLLTSYFYPLDWAIAVTSSEQLHKEPFACLPTALRPSGPVQPWIFHQAEQELTTLPGLRYSSGHRKGRLKILFVQHPIRFMMARCPNPTL